MRIRELFLEHVAQLKRAAGRALASNDLDAVVLHSGVPKKRTEFDDQYFPLRASPYVQHWVPIAEANAALVLRDGVAKLLRPRVTSFWERPAPLEPAWLLEPFEMVEVDDGADVVEHLGSRGRLAFVGEAREIASSWGIDPARVNPAPLMAALDQLRVRKSPYEIACLAEANRRAAVGHQAVLERFRAGGASELDLHLAFLSATQQDDQDTPYKNIVATGENAAVLHHVSYARTYTPRATLLLDAGATCNGYASDVSRTWVREDGGAAAATFAGLVAGVEAMQLRLIDAVRIGMGYEALHDESHRQLAEVLRDVGVVVGSPDEAVARGVTRAFLPHGLGHSLGLTCHDVGCAAVAPRADNPFLRNTAIIDAQQVFTIEPGVYFVDGLLRPLREGPDARLVDWMVVDALTPLGGVRIEDDVLVNAQGQGTRNLTRELLPVGGAAV